MLKISYRRTKNERWEGVLKDEAGAVVWSCGHNHECRDYNHSKWYAHTGAARYCARDELARRLKCEAA